MGAFDSLNFNVNVTDNASVVLSNVEKRLGQVTTQSISLANAELRLNNAHIANTKGTITYENALRRQQISKLNLAIANNNLTKAEAYLQQLQSTEGVNAEVVANAENRVYLAKINVIKAEEGLAIASANVNSARLSQRNSTNSVTIAENNLAKQMLATNKVSKTATLGIGRFFSKLFTGAIIARYVGGFLGSVVKETGSYIENLNLLSVAYGETYQETVEWAVDLAEGFGLATNEVIKFTGTFRQLATSMGIVKDTADSITQTIIELGYDISALYNTSVEEAMEKLQSGLYSGYTRPMRALGIDVSQNQVDNLFKTNEALKHLNVSAMNLKQGDKVLARLLITMQAAPNSFGTMNREINTLQSQIRILQGSFDNFKLAMGDLVHEPIKEALIYINAFIIAVTNVIRAFKPMTTKDETFVAFSNLGEEVDEASQSLDNLEGKLAKFDKFNVLGQGGSSSANAESAVTEALTAELKKQQKLYEERKAMFSDVENEAVKLSKSLVGWFLETDENGNIVFENDMPIWTDNAKLLGDTLKFLGLMIGSNFVIKIVKGVASLFTLANGFALLNTAIIGGALFAFMEMIRAIKEGDTATAIIAGTIGVTLVGAFVALKIAKYNSAKASEVATLASKKHSIELTKQSYALQQNAYYAKTATISLLSMVAAYGIAYGIIGSFDGEARKTASGIMILVGAIMAVTAAIVAMNTSISWGTMLPVLLAGVGAAIAGVQGLTTDVENIAGFANGGYTNANLIMTHENGKREWVGKAAGSSAIVNDTQMSDIMEVAVARGVYNALSARGELNGNTTTEQPIIIKIGEEEVFRAVKSSAKKQGLGFANI